MNSKKLKTIVIFMGLIIVAIFILRFAYVRIKEVQDIKDISLEK